MAPAIFDAVVEEQLLGVFDDLVIGEHAAAIGFNVDLVDVELAADGAPGGLEPLRVFHFQRAGDGDVDDRLETLLRIAGAGSKEIGGEKRC
jgi:hypothetical protein